MSTENASVWSEAFRHNEAIWRNGKISEKQNAWRKQKLMLAQKVQQLNPSIEHSVLKEHEGKCTGQIKEKYFQERIARCKTIVQQSRRTASNVYTFNTQLNKSVVYEPQCHGLYESCRHNEINPTVLQSNSNKNESNDSLNLPKRQCEGTVMQRISESPLINTTRPSLLMTSNTKTALPYQNASTCDSVDSISANNIFRTAREQLVLNDMQKKKQQGNGDRSTTAPCDMMNFRKKTLGVRRGVNSGFIPPTGQKEKKENESHPPLKDSAPANKGASSIVDIPSSLVNLDAQMVEQIMQESMHNFKNIAWSDIAGLESAKSTFLEAIILPLRRPDLYTGVRCPPRGVLLFGPPGTGKTLIAKSIASQAKAKFFSINPSSLTSKWVGEGEKLVRTLFAVAAAHQPAIIFIDEVDSLLSKRSGNEHESSLRLKNEFLIHLDGATSSDENRILVIGATNRPQELDEAVRRRFVRRLYIPLPNKDARHQIIVKIIGQVKHNLMTQEIEELAATTEGYSGADVDSLCRYASMAPLRALTTTEIDKIEAQQLPAVTMEDFRQALKFISKSVSPEDIERYASWNEIYGVKH